MKKSIISMLLLSTVSQTYALEQYNAIITKSHSNYTEQITTPEPIIYSSCKEILDNGVSIGDGIYEIKNNDKNYDVRCDMTSNGGGWTMVFAQYETDIAYSWDEGIQSDYDPSLVTKKSFSLNTSELPDHTQISFSQTDYNNLNTNGTYFDYIYTTGNIEKTLITNDIGKSFHIHRDLNIYFVAHNPEENTELLPEWLNTLTIDESGGRKFSFSYGINNSSPKDRGYSYNGEALRNTLEIGAWGLWVR